MIKNNEKNKGVFVLDELIYTIITDLIGDPYFSGEYYLDHSIYSYKDIKLTLDFYEKYTIELFHIKDYILQLEFEEAINETNSVVKIWDLVVNCIKYIFNGTPNILRIFKKFKVDFKNHVLMYYLYEESCKKFSKKGLENSIKDYLSDAEIFNSIIKQTKIYKAKEDVSGFTISQFVDQFKRDIISINKNLNGSICLIENEKKCLINYSNYQINFPNIETLLSLQKSIKYMPFYYKNKKGVTVNEIENYGKILNLRDDYVLLGKSFPDGVMSYCFFENASRYHNSVIIAKNLVDSINQKKDIKNKLFKKCDICYYPLIFAYEKINKSSVNNEYLNNLFLLSKVIFNNFINFYEKTNIPKQVTYDQIYEYINNNHNYFNYVDKLNQLDELELNIPEEYLVNITYLLNSDFFSKRIINYKLDFWESLYHPCKKEEPYMDFSYFYNDFPNNKIYFDYILFKKNNYNSKKE